LIFSLSNAFESDPKRLAFTFSRYKFAARMLSGLENVLEVGAADCVASLLVKQQVKNLLCTDIDEQTLFSIDPMPGYPIKKRVHNILDGPIHGLDGLGFDGVFSLDTMEHIREETLYLTNIADSLKHRGVFVVGMPSLESQAYASPDSKAHHVNCKTQEGLKASLKEHFAQVFCFGMNDETLHTGFGPMSHYLLALCLR